MVRGNNSLTYNLQLNHEPKTMNILLVIGIVILLGTIGGWVFQKLKMPAVMGYIIIGVLIGKSFHGILSGPILDTFIPIINLALGVIGFMIGAELKLDRFRKYSKSIYTILFCETTLTFLSVALVTTLLTKKVYLGLILGALSSATAPAATYSVLGEYKTRGPVTTTTFSIVALDDGFALILFGLASAFARSLMVHEQVSFMGMLGTPLFEISVSIIIGVIAAYALNKIVRYTYEPEHLLPFTIGIIILVVGVSIFLKVDFILASMALGAVVSNLQSPENPEKFESLKKFSYPIYILFFVLVGARLDARILIIGSVLSLAMSYILARCAGKMAGAYIGGKLSRARDTVTKYLGFCLFDQAGVAVGLAIATYNNFTRMGYHDAGLLVINIITATTFLLQLLAPPMIKYGIKKADEMYRNVTEDDIIRIYKVGSIMDKDIVPIKINNNLHQILDIMKQSEGYNFPIVGPEGQFRGITSLGEIRDTIYEEQMDQLILAEDIMRETDTVAYEEQELGEVMNMFKTKNIEYLPVLENEKTRRLVGQLEYRRLIDRISKEVLLRQQEIET